MTVPGTLDHMAYYSQADGMIATITKDVPATAIRAIQPMFDHLRTTASTSLEGNQWTQLKPQEFDWALHPGGAAILAGAQQALHLNGSHLHASRNIYESYGNSSSPTVLIVLDELRKLGPGRDHVISASFGPGMMIEMCVMKRCRDVEVAPPIRVKKSSGKSYKLWLRMQSKFFSMMSRITGPGKVSKLE